MKSPEYITHGTSSEKDAQKIQEEGFEAREGRATVSGDLIYAFEWAARRERRKGSKSQTEVGEEEKGRMIIMKVPENKSVDYATDTDIEVDEAQKEITGHPSNYKSGRKHLAIYDGGDVAGKRKEAEPNIAIAQENILMSVVPTRELGDKLNELQRKIKKMEKVDLKKFTEEISKIIEDNKENFLASGLDVREVVANLLATTLETEVVNMARSLSMDVKRAQGFTIHNPGKGKLKEKAVDKEQLRQLLENIQAIVNGENFDIGMENLNRYMRINVRRLLEELG